MRYGSIMKGIRHWNLLGGISKLVEYLFLILCLTVLVTGCGSLKTVTTIYPMASPEMPSGVVKEEITEGTTDLSDVSLDDHVKILVEPLTDITIYDKEADSLIQITPGEEGNVVVDPEVLTNETELTNGAEVVGPVALKIVENYNNAVKKEPGGDCLAVSKGRFMKAYWEIYGHSVYRDLPNHMATNEYTAREVFDNLYVSASGVHKGWRNLPEKYRGKGNAGAIAYAGMGTLIDSTGIWGGKLRPGALLQVWRYKNDYLEVVKGVENKELDPYGHSFIFLEYVHDENNDIIGIRIADQGFQSYRPLLPRDYEVWWAVNLSI